MEPDIELRLLNYRLKIVSIKKQSIHKLMFPLVKIAFTNKTKCSFFSFTETNDDYSVVVDNFGFDELKSYLNEADITLSQSNWIPMYLSGADLQRGISKIAKYLILPLADWKISIMAISMYQCDYILIQEEDYEQVIDCLSNHIPRIYDESLSSDNELVFLKSNGKYIYNIRKSDSYNFSSSNNDSARTLKRQSTFDESKQRQITLPLLIPDSIEYCITGLYNMDTFFLIIPILIDIMFYETEDYEDNEIFFNFTKKELDVSLVMETRLLKKFPHGSLLNIENDYWRLIRIGQLPVGFEVFGVVASISQPLEIANIDEYYISSYHTGYCFIPSDEIDTAKELFAKQKAEFVDSSKSCFYDKVDEDYPNEISNINSSLNSESLLNENSNSNLNYSVQVNILVHDEVDSSNKQLIQDIDQKETTSELSIIKKSNESKFLNSSNENIRIVNISGQKI